MQLNIFRLMPGYIGGTALLEKRGIAYLREIAAKGGRSTVNRYGREHMCKLGRLGAEARKKKRENEAQTIKHWDGSIRRVVPYRKPKSRKAEPEYVHILLWPNDDLL